MVDQDGKKRGAQPRLQSISFHGQTQFVRHNARLRTSSYASRSAVCSSDSPTSFLPFGKNQRSKISPCSSSWYCSRRTTTLPVDGWMMTIPAPSIKSCAGHRLSETPGEENGNVETRSCRVSRVERVCPRRALDGPFEPEEEFSRSLPKASTIMAPTIRASNGNEFTIGPIECKATRVVQFDAYGRLLQLNCIAAFRRVQMKAQ